MPGQQPKQSLVGRTIQSAESTTPVSYKAMEWLRSTSVMDTYLAVHTAVALKIQLQVLNSTYTAQSDFAARFTSQMKALVALSVPSLVQVYDYGRDGGSFFVVIEYHKSPTLRVKLDTDGRLPLPTALNHARLIAETLGYAAAQNVLHGLLSPDVITLSSRRGPLLDHFGLTPLLSVFLTRALSDDPKLGAYAAPELLAGQPVSTASDLYSLTALTYEMATGQMPFSGLSMAQAASAPVPNPAQIDPALAPLSAFIQRGMAKDPAARYLGYAEFNAAIQEVISATEPAKVPVTPPHAPEPVRNEAAGPPVANIPTYVPASNTAPAVSPAPLPKHESVEEDVGGRTIADMPIMAAPPTSPPQKIESTEEDVGGRTIADMPIIRPPDPVVAQPPPSPPTPLVAAPAAKREVIEEDVGGRTMADMPIIRPPEPAAPPPPPRVAASAAKREMVEEDVGGRTMADMPIARPPESRPVVQPPAAREKPPARAAAPPAPPPPPKAVEEDLSGRTMLEMPGAPHAAPPIPPSYPPAARSSPPPAYPGPQATVPRSVQNRYKTEPVNDENSASVPPSAVPYNFGSVPPTYAGAQQGSPGRLNDRYGTRTMDRSQLQGPDGSGITGFISTPASGIPTPRRRSPALLIVLVLIVLLVIAAAVGFVVLRAIHVIPS